jgi:signal transduction histidine kinase
MSEIPFAARLAVPMKITTRIISGYGLFIAILAGLVLYQVITIGRMQETSRTLSEINFQNAVTCLTASSDLEWVEDFTRKTFGSADPRYRQQLQEYQEAFQQSLMELKMHAASGEEREEIKRLSRHWDGYLADLLVLQQGLPPQGSVLPANLQEDLENLNSQTRSVYHVTLQAMSSKVEASRKAGETAVLVLWCATVAAFAISILVSLLIIRSISKPLAHLTEGTRAIADGKFFYRLDTTRNDEFSQLARDFNKMTLRLNELDELKKDFVSHVSHELKAPLASMHETIQIMLDEIPGPLTDKQKRLLELNLQSGTRLTSMIRNLLDLSKTEAGAMEYELKSRDLVPLVRNAIAELEGQVQEKQAAIKTVFPETLLPVECDSDRIVQVMLNLIGNAVKFSPRHSEVWVRVEKLQQIPETIPERWRRLIQSTAPEGPYGLVIVEDSGPGIPDSDKEKIFEKFHQIKQGKKMAGQGVGLGLAICRTIVQAHRGAIWVEDHAGGGSRFMVLLRGGEGVDVSPNDG